MPELVTFFSHLACGIFPHEKLKVQHVNEHSFFELGPLQGINDTK